MSDVFTPSMNDGKNIFVFGSNLRGRHGKGAAYEAFIHWGATYGVGVGRIGQSYAIPTKDSPNEVLTLSEITLYVDQFIEYAKAHPELTFLVTKIGCGLAGFHESQIAVLFLLAPPNCVLPEGWRRIVVTV